VPCQQKSYTLSIEYFHGNNIVLPQDGSAGDCFTLYIDYKVMLDIQGANFSPLR
jgi:hypothetical protein